MWAGVPPPSGAGLLHAHAYSSLEPTPDIATSQPPPVPPRPGRQLHACGAAHPGAVPPPAHSPPRHQARWVGGVGERCVKHGEVCAGRDGRGGDGAPGGLVLPAGSGGWCRGVSTHVPVMFLGAACRDEGPVAVRRLRSSRGCKGNTTRIPCCSWETEKDTGANGAALRRTRRPTATCIHPAASELSCCLCHATPAHPPLQATSCF